MDLLFNMEIYAVSCVSYEIKFCHFPLFSFGLPSLDLVNSLSSCPHSGKVNVH